MAIGKGTSQRPYTEASTIDITVGDTAIQQVSNFTYLGSIISSVGTCYVPSAREARAAVGGEKGYRIVVIWRDAPDASLLSNFSI